MNEYIMYYVCSVKKIISLASAYTFSINLRTDCASSFLYLNDLFVFQFIKIENIIYLLTQTLVVTMNWKDKQCWYVTLQEYTYTVYFVNMLLTDRTQHWLNLQAVHGSFPICR